MKRRMTEIKVKSYQQEKSNACVKSVQGFTGQVQLSVISCRSVSNETGLLIKTSRYFCQDHYTGRDVALQFSGLILHWTVARLLLLTQNKHHFNQGK